MTMLSRGKIVEFFAQHKRVISRLIRDASLPTCAGVLWGLAAGIQKHSVIDGISAASIAFFLILSLQNQFFRVERAVRDEDDANEFRSSFASIRQAIAELQAQGIPVHQLAPGPAQIHEVEPPVGYIHSTRPIPLGFNSFLVQARRAIETDQYYAAILLAAVGFEFAAREAGRQLGLDSDRAILGRLVRELGRRTESRKAMETLNTLTKLRNGIVHAEKEMPWVSREQAEDLISAFTRGAEYLEMAA
jgi:hypothetical protein